MGLIDSVVDTTKKAPNPLDPMKNIAQAKSFGYDPAMGKVDAATDTVQGQLAAILEKDNPYITRARASAAQAANSRGLINSTMGAQAGEAAAIDAALPIASQDAGIFSTQRLTNQAAENTAGQFEAGAANTAGQFNTGQFNQFGLIGSQMGAQKELIGATGEETRKTQAQGGDISARIANLQGEIQTGLIGETGAQTRMTDAQRVDKEKELVALQGEQQRLNIGAGTTGQKELAQTQADILTKQTLDAQTKAEERLIQARALAQYGLNEQQIQAAAKIDDAHNTLARDLDLANRTGDGGKVDLLTRQIGANEKAATSLGILQKQLAEDERTGVGGRKDLLTQQLREAANIERRRDQLVRDLDAASRTGEGGKVDLLTRQINANEEAATQVFLRASTLQQESSAQKIQQLIAAGQNDQALQTLKGSQAESLANIEGGFKALLQANASAAATFTGAGKIINEILANPDTSVGQKQALVDQQTNVLHGALAVFGGLAGDANLNALLDWNIDTTQVASTNTGGMAAPTQAVV